MSEFGIYLEMIIVVGKRKSLSLKTIEMYLSYFGCTRVLPA